MAEPTDGQVPYGPGFVPGLGDATSGRAAVVLPTPETVERLTPGPRPVPAAYRAATLDFKVAELVVVFVALVITVDPSGSPDALPPVLLGLVTAGVVAFRVRRYARRMRLLRDGEVARVTSIERVAGALRSTTSYSNVRIRSAHGWTLDRGWYSGSGYKTDVHFEVTAGPGVVRVSGREYAGGVVLADPQDPGLALCVSSFPHDLTPHADGQWPGGLPSSVWAGVFVTIASYALLVASLVRCVLRLG